MSIGGISKVKAVSMREVASTMTLAEVMDGLSALAKAPLSKTEKLAQLANLRKAGEKLPLFGTPFEQPYINACLKVVFAAGGPSSIRAFLDAISQRLHSVKDAARPLATTNARMDANAHGFHTGNAQVASMASALIYEKDAKVQGHLQKAGYKDVQIHDAARTGARAVTAANKDAVLVDFCGTADPCDFLKDSLLKLTNKGATYGTGKVHLGFTLQLDSLWPDIKAQIQKARAEHPDRPVMFTGHSLGGSLAVLALARAKSEGLLDNPPHTGSGPAAMLYTFGQPRVGDAAFAAGMGKMLADNNIPYVRTIHRGDPVAQVPPTGMGYADVESTAVFHDPKGKTHVGLDLSGPIFPRIPQDMNAAATMELVRRTLNQVTDHNESNYAVLGARNALDKDTLVR